jgi:regulator of protease activity HflC (stomatin/prohibitin superfamily)
MQGSVGLTSGAEMRQSRDKQKGQIHDRWTPTLSGFLIFAALIAGGIWIYYNLELIRVQLGPLFERTAIGVGIAFAVLVLPGFVVIRPNESIVLTFFGSYLGTVKATGFHWVIPFTSRQRVSRRIVNFNTNTIKVNDSRGNPIEIGAVVVWRVSDAASAVLNVTDYRNFVEVQGETAVRTLAMRFPYDSDEGEESLRGSTDEIAHELSKELQDRLDVAGVEVIEARLSHLAYAPEIASALLRKQQAQAVVSARRIITENAVHIVDNALKQLEASGVLEVTGAERTRLVSNLLVTLVSETAAQPVLDLGGRGT